MNIEKKKEKFQKRYEKASMGDTVKVVKFKRKDFKDELGQANGFGFQDLKDDAKELYRWMMCENMDIHIAPESLNTEDFSVLITVKKVGLLN